MSFEFDISPIDNEAGDFHHRFSVELFKAFARAKKDNVCGRKLDDVECPKCGKLLIRKGGNVNRWY